MDSTWGFGMILIEQYGSFGPGGYDDELDRPNSAEQTTGWQLNGHLPVLADMVRAPVCWARKWLCLSSGVVWNSSRGSTAWGPKASSGGLLTMTPERLFWA